SGAQGVPTPDGGSQAPTDSGSTQDTGPGGPAPGHETAAPGRDERSGGWWRTVTSSCRDLRDGKQLSVDRRRTLESAAGGSVTVRKYCRSVLTGVGESAGSLGDDGKGDDGRENDESKTKDKDGKDKGDDDHRDRDRDRDRGKGGGHDVVGLLSGRTALPTLESVVAASVTRL
ncbi:hypothetical protein PBV88_24695, partial [Streptomyces sp. T21Q-yed]|nr:hypothetical protein [Streptomyces sp. T21Q-yed]